MCWRACLWAVGLTAVLGFLAGSAHATGQGNTAIQKWKTMDVCARQAQAAFPDFTPYSNAKRDAKLRD